MNYQYTYRITVPKLDRKTLNSASYEEIGEDFTPQNQVTHTSWIPFDLKSSNHRPDSLTVKAVSDGLIIKHKYNLRATVNHIGSLTADTTGLMQLCLNLLG